MRNAGSFSGLAARARQREELLPFADRGSRRREGRLASNYPVASGLLDGDGHMHSRRDQGCGGGATQTDETEREPRTSLPSPAWGERDVVAANRLPKTGRWAASPRATGNALRRLVPALFLRCPPPPPRPVSGSLFSFSSSAITATPCPHSKPAPTRREPRHSEQRRPKGGVQAAVT